MELSSDCLARQKTALTDQKFATFVECSARKYDLLGAVFEQSTMALLEETEQKADKASTQTLRACQRKC